MTPRTQRELWVVAGVALATRLLWLLEPQWQGGDAAEYLQIADGIRHLGAFTSDGVTPSAYRPPLYPALIALASIFTTQAVQTMLLAQVLIGTATVLLTFLVARHAFGLRVALVSAILLAIAPMTARYSTVLVTETLFVFLVMAATWGWQRGHGVIAGVLLGCAALTRASLGPFILITGIAGLVSFVLSQRRLALVMTVSALLTVAPWVVRNVWHFGTPTIASAGWGLNLLYGTVNLRPGSHRWEQILSAASLPDDDVPSKALEVGARNEAVQRIRRDPAAWVRARIAQYPWLFVDTGDYLPIAANRYTFANALATGRVTTVFLKIGFLAGNALLTCLAVYGAWRSRARWRELRPLWAFPVYLAVAHIPMYVEPRYGLPLVPFVCIFASVAVQAFLNRTQGSKLIGLVDRVSS